MNKFQQNLVLHYFNLTLATSSVCTGTIQLLLLEINGYGLSTNNKLPMPPPSSPMILWL